MPPKSSATKKKTPTSATKTPRSATKTTPKTPATKRVAADQRTATPPSVSEAAALEIPAISPKTPAPKSDSLTNLPQAISPSPGTAVSFENVTSPKIASVEAGTIVAGDTLETDKDHMTPSLKSKDIEPDVIKSAEMNGSDSKKIKKKIVKKIVIKRCKAKSNEKGQTPAKDEKSGPEPDPSVPMETEDPIPDSGQSNLKNLELGNRKENENEKQIEEKKENAKGGECTQTGEEELRKLKSGQLDSENLEAVRFKENADGKGLAELNEQGEGGKCVHAGVEELRKTKAAEKKRRRKTEIFIGGLDKDAKEEDIRKVFEKAGEVIEIRLMMDIQTGKNKGYAFLRYASPAEAKRATTEFAKVQVCGKVCAAVAAEGNDTIYIGNIDKNWKKEDLMKSLQEIGIENIVTATVVPDLQLPDFNRGFAFLELETNRDAQIAFKKLQKKDAFGINRNVKVSWAEPFYEPDEDDLQKVKSVFVEGIPSSWDEEKVKKHFIEFGEIERVVLSRNMQSSKRRDFAIVNYITRDAALSCIDALRTEELIDEGSKLNVKASLAKPIPKPKQNKGRSKAGQDYSKEKSATKNDVKVTESSNNVRSFNYSVNGDVNGKSSATLELVQVVREQAARGQKYVGLPAGSSVQGHAYTLSGGKRQSSAMGNEMIHSDPRGYPRPRLDGSYASANSSYGTLSHTMSGTSLPYYQHLGAAYAAGGIPHGTMNASSEFQQLRQGAIPYGGNLYPNVSRHPYM